MDLFDRRILHRSLCIQKSNVFNKSYIKAESEAIINERIKDFQLTTNVDYIKCTNGITPTTFYDYLILSIVMVYATFVIFSTYYEKIHRSKKEKTGLHRIISEFSIFYNWKKKTDISKNENYEKLSCMQGLRLFTMTLIIIFHTYAVYVFIYLSNPTYFEFLMSQPSVQYIQIMNMHLVLNFFLLSSWLLTIQVNEIIKKHGQFSMGHVRIIILNRYFRLITTSAFVILLFSTSWPVKIFSGPLNFDVVEKTQHMCKRNFLYDFLFLQNYLNATDMCNPVSWYIAADFQLYILNVAVLYLWNRFKFNKYKYFAAVFVISLLVYGYVLYVYKSNGIYLMNLRNAELIAVNYLPENLVTVTYMSAYSIFPASLIGTIFGFIYVKLRDQTIKITPLRSSLWTMLFFGLPLLVLILDTLELQKIPAAILGSISKPVYCLGIASGIFGMSHNFGGRIKKYFEHKYVVLLGNFTYCPYICHWLFMLGRHRNTPPFVDGTTMVTDAASLLIKACFFGVIISLTVEEPGLSMQKKILPQIRKYEVCKERKK